MNSTALPWFGRAYQVTIETHSGQTVQFKSNGTADDLTITFEIDTYVLATYWTATVRLFNLNQGSSNAITAYDPFLANGTINTGDKISISAGYEYAFDPGRNLIFEGTVYQPIIERPDAVTTVVTLNCCLGLMQDAYNFVSTTVGPNATHDTCVKAICKSANLPIEKIDSETLAQQKMPRGQIFHGRPLETLRPIGKFHALETWLSPHGVNMRSLSFDPSVKPDIVYCPPHAPNVPSNAKPTIIGVPAQQPQGINFCVEMDSEVKLGDIIQLSGITPNVLRRPLPGQGIPTVLDPRGVYSVYSIRHVGDSRGDDWYTEIGGLTAQYWSIWEAVRSRAGLSTAAN
jgi:hypothetical protein